MDKGNPFLSDDELKALDDIDSGRAEHMEDDEDVDAPDMQASADDDDATSTSDEPSNEADDGDDTDSDDAATAATQAAEQQQQDTSPQSGDDDTTDPDSADDSESAQHHTAAQNVPDETQLELDDTPTVMPHIPDPVEDYDIKVAEQTDKLIELRKRYEQADDDALDEAEFTKQEQAIQAEINQLQQRQFAHVYAVEQAQAQNSNAWDRAYQNFTAQVLKAGGPDYGDPDMKDQLFKAAKFELEMGGDKSREQIFLAAHRMVLARNGYEAPAAPASDAAPAGKRKVRANPARPGKTLNDLPPASNGAANGADTDRFADLDNMSEEAAEAMLQKMIQGGDSNALREYLGG